MMPKLLRASLWFLACVALIIAVGSLAMSGVLGSRFRLGGDVIASINIEGIITGATATGSLLGGATASSTDICDKLYEARDDARVRAVVLRIDSPGGAAAASDEIYHAVASCREKKPVVVSMGDVAASGGYYIASAGSYIYASGATLTGSIGVVFSLYSWEQLAKKVGVEDETLKAGEYKDIGSPWRAMTPSERGVMQGLMNDVHEQFIRAVAQGRKSRLSEEQVRALATGMIYTGEGAVKNGLIDELGGLHDAEVKARKLAGVGDNVPIEEYGAGGLLQNVFRMQMGGGRASALLNAADVDPLTLLARTLLTSPLVRDLAMR